MHSDFTINKVQDFLIFVIIRFRIPDMAWRRVVFI